jgi:hypothetical protein
MTSYYPVTDEIVWHESLLDGMLGALTVVPGDTLLDGVRVGLRTGAHTINPRVDDPDSVTPATFTGYAKQTPTFVGPVNLTTYGRGVQTTVTFLCTADIDPVEEITGWYLMDGGAGAPTLLYAEGEFADPLIIQKDGDAITLTIVLPIRSVQTR